MFIFPSFFFYFVTTTMLSRFTRTHTLAASARLFAASRGLQTSTYRPFVKSTDHDAAATETEESTNTTTTTTKQGRANEIIEAVLYGSKKIKEEERQTHSKVLARGKYVHELQSKLEYEKGRGVNSIVNLISRLFPIKIVHKVKPDKVDEYVELV